MTTRLRIPALICVAAGFLGTSAFAADAPPTTASETGHQWHGGHGRHGGEFHHVLRQLNLTAEQKTQIKAIFEQAKTTYGAQHANARSNHESLAAMSPNDPAYPAALAAEKANAATRVQAASDIKAQIYAVLTPAQQAQIPAIIAADRAARDAKVAAWRSQHAS